MRKVSYEDFVNAVEDEDEDMDDYGDIVVLVVIIVVRRQCCLHGDNKEQNT